MFQVLHVTCHVSHVIFLNNFFKFFFNLIFFLDKVVKLIGGGLLSTGPTPSSLLIVRSEVPMCRNTEYSLAGKRSHRGINPVGILSTV